MDNKWITMMSTRTEKHQTLCLRANAATYKYKSGCKHKKKCTVNLKKENITGETQMKHNSKDKCQKKRCY